MAEPRGNADSGNMSDVTDKDPKLGSDKMPPQLSMEARIAVIESDVGYIKRDVAELKSDVKELRRDDRTDFRMLFGAIIVVALGLAGLMAKGFRWL
jgi:hypothetical protein